MKSLEKKVTESIIFLDCGPCGNINESHAILSDKDYKELAWLSNRISDVIENNDSIQMIITDTNFVVAVGHNIYKNHLHKNCKSHQPLYIPAINRDCSNLDEIIISIKESMNKSEVILILIYSEHFVELPKAFVLGVFGKEVNSYPKNVGFGCGVLLNLKKLKVHKLYKMPSGFNPNLKK